jgi:hypothetical protein
VVVVVAVVGVAVVVVVGVAVAVVVVVGVSVVVVLVVVVVAVVGVVVAVVVAGVVAVVAVVVVAVASVSAAVCASATPLDSRAVASALRTSAGPAILMLFMVFSRSQVLSHRAEPCYVLNTELRSAGDVSAVRKCYCEETFFDDTPAWPPYNPSRFNVILTSVNGFRTAPFRPGVPVIKCFHLRHTIDRRGTP